MKPPEAKQHNELMLLHAPLCCCWNWTCAWTLDPDSEHHTDVSRGSIDRRKPPGTEVLSSPVPTWPHRCMWQQNTGPLHPSIHPSSNCVKKAHSTINGDKNLCVLLFMVCHHHLHHHHCPSLQHELSSPLLISCLPVILLSASALPVSGSADPRPEHGVPFCSQRQERWDQWAGGHPHDLDQGEAEPGAEQAPGRPGSQRRV